MFHDSIFPTFRDRGLLQNDLIAGRGKYGGPLVVYACVALHIGDRAEQQDRVCLILHPKRSGVALAVVADGMGGHSGGALAAEQVLHTARANLERYSARYDAPRSVIEESMLEAHSMIKTMRLVNEKDPHSTAVMLLVQPGKVTWAHCGDSRLYRFHDDEFVSRTIDHSYVQFLVDEGEITSEEALVHTKRNSLLTSLGGLDEPNITFGEANELRGGDTFLLCSDGVWSYFSEEELAQIVSCHDSREIANRLIDGARERARGEGDNLALAVLKVVEAPEDEEEISPRLRFLARSRFIGPPERSDCE